MKLATYKDGSRDGQLVVVSRDLGLAHFVPHLVNRLQSVLDDWNYLAPQLQDIFEALNAGRARHAFPFDPARCMAPLPRAYQWVYTAAAVPAQTQAVQLQQGASDVLLGPRDPLFCPAAINGIDFAAQFAVVTADLRAGADTARALDSVRLVMLANVVHWHCQSGVASQPAVAFSPVALTPDELGDAWSRGALRLPLHVLRNGQDIDTGRAPVWPVGPLLAELAATRALAAGCILGSGALAGSLQAGDTVGVDVKNAAGQSLFGAIEQQVLVRAASAADPVTALLPSPN